MAALDDVAASPTRRRPRRRLPSPGGPFRPSVWRSPIRGPWLTSVFGAALLVGIPIMFVTGLVSYAAYNPRLGHNDTDAAPGPPRLLPVQLGDQSQLGLPGEPGHPCGPRVDPHPDPAGQAVVGAAEAVRLASGPFGRPRPRTGQPGAARRWRGVPVRDRHLEHRLLVRVEVLLLRRPPVRGVGLHGRVRRPRHPQAAGDGPFPALAPPARRAGHAARRHRPRAPRPSTAWWRPTRRHPPCRGAAPWPWSAERGGGVRPHRGPDRPTAALRRVALLSPRGRSYGSGPNDFQVNRTASTAGIRPAATGDSWRLELVGARQVSLSPGRPPGHAAAHGDVAHRVRRGLVDRAALDRCPADGPGPSGRRRPADHGVRAVARRRPLRPDRASAPSRSAPATPCWRCTSTAPS